jgi:hypothetical protein
VFEVLSIVVEVINAVWAHRRRRPRWLVGAGTVEGQWRIQPSQPLNAIERLRDLADELRDRVNYARRHHLLARDPQAWNTTCSAMDIVGDTCQALIAYFKQVPAANDDKAAAYLLAYGVLQALFLQQDAVYWWCKCLAIQPVSDHRNPCEWVATVPQLARARTARNDSIGHPARRDRPRTSPVAAFSIAQHSLSGHGFEVHGYDDRGASSVHHVSFTTLISEQVEVLADALEAACVALDKDDREHHRRFMNKPLTPILNRLQYPLEKLGADRTDIASMFPALIDEILKALEELRKAIEERQEPFDAGWSWKYRKIGRALKVLSDYARADAVHRDDDLADVAGDFVRYAIDELRQMTEELDDRYAVEEEG